MTTLFHPIVCCAQATARSRVTWALLSAVSRLGLVLLLALLITSCSDQAFDYQHPDVDLFARQLKAGHLTTSSGDALTVMPCFTVDDIDRLLDYAEDLTPIPAFPLAAVSYSPGGRLRLGECILWVVESIRLGQNASMGCKMVHTDADDYTGTYFLTDQELLDAAAYYRRWWQSTQAAASMPDILHDAPLAGSRYMWW